MSTETTTDSPLSRRSLLLSGATAAATMTLAQSAQASSHGGHDHHKMHAGHGNSHAGHGYTPPNAQVQALIDGAMDCQKDGQACIEHCVQLLKGGDLSMGECLDRAQEMLVMCTAMGRLAGFQSAHLKKVVSLCIDICSDCKVACEKHADKHAECRACAKSCDACIKAAKAYLAA
uniref:Uncharacterized protein n=1 Tax=Magnetococcus massalia (strain MO-1) TaxID=451514 RepID=A0A1S7LLN0_MAGMO|nr:conserved Tat exported protein of unknown function [Candidatus Magnetococcus massalia]